ncbi:hypothetical protein ASE17_06450 [Phenylobacterium sp. Root77]|uniref:hypothetical protein n=1 Tax=unclassified Phenylobacterium TaxID=2640670 RepID=UPI0006F5DB75|nr:MULTISPECIES: hypothetical protein [unclassified Phenylobacterium]KQW68095.1 hypothetical protein ASC73_16355 [Phenylobacterium sp. Root1277]KQW91838.1 hypothetical protein ASC79_09730 [Phenylobacterium sp. Root1290]KRC40069.1 hypothetical protein ASE17_06450 [Phenylobacterium sp. Root77]
MSVLKTVVLVALASSLSGCVYSQKHLSSDFGYAVRQAAVAQITNPDAVYSAVPQPPSDGARAAGAQERYRTGKVIQPTGLASSISSAASVGGETN